MALTQPALVAKVVKIFRSQASLALKDAGKDLQAMQRAGQDGQAEAMPWQQPKNVQFLLYVKKHIQLKGDFRE